MERMCIRTEEDIDRFKEVLLGYKRCFQIANNLENSTIELADVSAVSKIQVLLQFKISHKVFEPEGFYIKFEGNYADSIDTIVTALCQRIRTYTARLSTLFNALYSKYSDSVLWYLHGEDELYFFGCKADLPKGFSTRTVQFDQNSVEDTEYMIRICTDCVDWCLPR